MVSLIQSSHCLMQWNRYGTPGLLVPSTQAGEINIFGPVCSDDEADFWKWFYKTDYHTSDVAFKEALAAIEGKKAKLVINSPGGSVWAGSTIRSSIQTAIADGMEFEAHVVGLAASAAGIIAIAAPKITIADMGAFMMHRASVGYDAWGYGNEEDLQVVINDFESKKQSLKTINEAQTKVFMEKMGKSRDEVRELLRKETWFNADDAIEAGLANEVQQSSVKLPEPQKAELPGAFERTVHGGIAVSQPAYRFAAAAGLTREQLTELMRSEGGDSTGTQKPHQPAAARQEPGKPAVQTSNNGAASMNDSEVREVLGLPASAEVTDAQRAEAWRIVYSENKTLKADKAKAERKAVLAKAKEKIKAHVTRGAITPVQMTGVLRQIMAAADPEEQLEIQDEILEMLADGDDESQPGATARQPKGAGKAPAGLDGTDEERQMAHTFQRKVLKLIESGLDIATAQDQVLEEMDDDHFMAWSNWDFDADPVDMGQED